MNKIKIFIGNVQDTLETVVLSLKTYEDIVVGFVSNNPRTTMWIWAGTLYLTWRFS